MRKAFLSLAIQALVVCGAMLLTMVLATAAKAGSCRQAGIVKAAAADFMRAGRSGSTARIQQALNRHVDMRRVMSFALGRKLRKLRGSERRRFFRQASGYAARKLALLARQVRGSGVEVVRCRGNRVETRLLPGGERIVWKLRGGRIVDVNYHGVWMALLLRDHFRRMWRRAGDDSRAFLAQLVR